MSWVFSGIQARRTRAWSTVVHCFSISTVSTWPESSASTTVSGWSRRPPARGTSERQSAPTSATANCEEPLKELRDQNTRLKRLLAEAELEKDALREVAKGKF